MRSREDLLISRTSRELLLDLLRTPEANRLANALGLKNSGDVFAALRSIEIRRGSERERLLFEFFELVVPAPNEVAYVPSSGSVIGELSLFEHQRTAVREVRTALSQEPHRVLLHMPTGAGKTRMAMQVIADHLRTQEPALAVWLAYSEELCEQAASEFESTWAVLGDREVNVNRFWGPHSLELERASDGIVIAGLAKLFIAGRQGSSLLGTLAGRCTLVIIDEAHQAIAPAYRLVLDMLVTQGRAAGLLGLTATPGRTWNDPSADAELSDYFGRHKVGLRIEGYTNPIAYLVAEGYLARVNYRTLPSGSGLGLSSADMKEIGQELDIPERILKRLAEDDQRNLAIIVEVEKLIRRHKRVLIFAASVEHSHLLAAVLSARGHDAAAVTGTTSSLERSRLLARYKGEGDDPRIICNYGVLTTGFNAPKTSAALIARPTKSLVLYSQMVGRATRGPKVGGNVDAEVVTVVDTELPGFGSMAEAFGNWEDVWREE